MEYLLNKKAYEIFTGQKHDELFKTKALILVKISIKEMKALNLTKDSEQKVFTSTKEGIGRVLLEGNECVIDVNTWLSDEACEIGKAKAGYHV